MSFSFTFTLRLLVHPHDVKLLLLCSDVKSLPMTMLSIFCQLGSDWRCCMQIWSIHL